MADLVQRYKDPIIAPVAMLATRWQERAEDAAVHCRSLATIFEHGIMDEKEKRKRVKMAEYSCSSGSEFETEGSNANSSDESCYAEYYAQCAKDPGGEDTADAYASHAFTNPTEDGDGLPGVTGEGHSEPRPKKIKPNGKPPGLLAHLSQKVNDQILRSKKLRILFSVENPSRDQQKP
jgi:hypothetical protein